MAKYIYHSEKTKTTCKECLKYDGKVFYDIKDLPQLPIHPNCKCWIETVEDRSDKKECDCKDRTQVLKNNLSNIIENTNTMQESIKSELLECAIALENPAYQNYSSDFQTTQEKLISFKDKLTTLIKSTKDLFTDIEILKEQTFDPTYHTKSQCHMTSGLNKYADLTSNLCKKLNDLAEEFKKVKEERKALSKKAISKTKDKTEKPHSDFQKNKAMVTNSTTETNSLKKADFSKLAKNNFNMQINMKLNAKYLNAQELANIFLAKPKNAPNSKEYRRIGSDYVPALNKKYNLYKTNKEVNKNWSGFMYLKNSTLAKNASNSIELQNQIRKQYDYDKKKFKTNKIEVSFSDTNLLLALGHATVLEPKIDKNNNFQGVLFDKYDFDALYKLAYSKPMVYAANNYFWLLQASCDRNFYILAPISFKW